jgi:hypothetical protein
LPPHRAIERLPLADTCLHALARQIERGTDHADAAVIADLFALAEAYPN